MTGISLSGVPELKAALERLDGKDRRNTLRRAVRAGAKPFRQAMAQVAAEQGLPRTFRKIPAPKVTTHGSASGAIEANVRPSSPLFNILEPGAAPHAIAPRSAAFLSNQGDGESSRSAPFFARGEVHHPGLKSRAISPRAFQIAEPAAMAAFADVVAGAAAAKGGED